MKAVCETLTQQSGGKSARLLNVYGDDFPGPFRSASSRSHLIVSGLPTAHFLIDWLHQCVTTRTLRAPQHERAAHYLTPADDASAALIALLDQFNAMPSVVEIGRAHDCTPVTNAPTVCRLP